MPSHVGFIPRPDGMRFDRLISPIRFFHAADLFDYRDADELVEREAVIVSHFVGLTPYRFR